jgi:hypothetical protein
MSIFNKIKTRTYLTSDNNDNYTSILEYAFEEKDTKVTIYNFLNQLLADNEYVPAKGDRVYIYPDSTIPRFKLKSFCQTNKVAIIRDKDKANVKIINSKFTKNLFTTSHYNYYKRYELLEHLEKYGKLSFPFISNTICLLKEQTSEIVEYDYYVNNMLKSTEMLGKAYYEKDYDNDPYDGYNSFKFVDKAAYDQAVILSQAADHYYEDNLLKQINTGGVMDITQYESIKHLFNSSDNDNTKLAIEAMANCDFQKSAVFLLLLIDEYPTKIWESPNRSHVNFQSLIKFFDINIRSMNTNNIVKSLIQRNLLNRYNLDILLPIMKENVNSSHRSDFISVDTVKLSDEIHTALANNILDKDHNTVIVDEPEEEINPSLKLIINNTIS